MAVVRDYYEVLGVEKTADAKTIKRAFLKLARTLHPDVNKEPDAEARFKEVNEAYSVLSDERKRANYDRYGSAEGPGGFGADYVDMSDIFGGGFGIDDLFSSFFGGSSRGGRTQATRTRGRDMGITLTITLEEAAKGTTKTVSYERLAPCDDCHGTGLAEDGHVTTCAHCGGTGRVVEVQQTIFGQMQSQSTCPVCAGTGKVIDHPCETCEGQGRCPSHESVEVTIPAGIHSGQSISIKDKGEAGVRGERGGDLLVRIEVASHTRFERQGDDLYCQVSVDALQAVVGCTTTLAGIMQDEVVEVTIPAGCAYGQQIELEGYGMPRLNSRARGKLMVVVEVVPPQNLTQDELACVQELVDARALRDMRDARAKGNAHTQDINATQAAQEQAASNRSHNPKSSKRTKRAKRA